MDKNRVDSLVKQGLSQAAAITKEHAKSFYFASRFLNQEIRSAGFCVYAICRISDDSVDKEEPGQKKLTEIKAKIEAAYNNQPLEEELLLAFRETINKYKIPKTYFDQLLEGIGMDLYKKRYQNFKELYDYCFKVAGVVGLIMLRIFGYKDKAAEKYAEDLGVAMQLTNILRDIKEDFQRQRIYLPEDEMGRFGVYENNIAKESLDNNFKELLKFQIKRARQYYRNSENGIKMIVNLRSRFATCAMKEIYAGILDAIEDNNYNVFSKRAYVSKGKKVSTIFKILLQGRYL